MQAGSYPYTEPVGIPLPALAERLAERFRTQTQKHTIVVDFPEKFPMILADEDRIIQVISNLISNAIKYAPDGEFASMARSDRNRLSYVSATRAPVSILATSLCIWPVLPLG